MKPKDGIALSSVAHPVAPWYRRLWMWLVHRDIRKSALETVEIELKPTKRRLGDFL